LIVVDSNIWIDHFAARANRYTTLLARMIGDGDDVVVGDIVLFEVLAGYRRERDYRAVRYFLETFRLVPMAGSRGSMRPSAIIGSFVLGAALRQWRTC
jgi:predicted nucleic acid-binding protein